MKNRKLGLWIAIGVAMGAGLGVAMKNIPIGVGMGAGIGVVVGMLASRQSGPDE